MKVAVTIGKVRIPPTYFAVQHSLRLLDRHDIRTFALTADITDEAVLATGLRIVEGMPGWLDPVRSREPALALAVPRLTRLIRDFEPDVIHQHFANWSHPATTAARSTGAPLITTFHGGDAFMSRRALGDVPLRARPLLAWHQRNVRTAVAQSTRLLSVSAFLAGELVATGIDAARIAVHYQGIDTDYFTPEASAEQELPTVLFVGGLTPLKGIRDLVRASSAVVADHPHRLVVVGRGALRAELDAAAAEHPHIELRGALTHDEVRAEQRAAAVMVLPTQETRGVRESAGLVLLEAQACGTPVIAYASGGTPEMLVDGETGLLVEEKNEARLAGALRELLGMPSREREAMGARGREFVVTHRSLAGSALELEQHYADVAR